MAIIQIGALRFAGLVADVGTLPLDLTLDGAIFDATDETRKWVSDGTQWTEFVGGSGGGGITGLNPNSTILEYSTDIGDYTTPTSATATSPPPIPELGQSQDVREAGLNICDSGCTFKGLRQQFDAGSPNIGKLIVRADFFLRKVGTPTGTLTAYVYDASDVKQLTLGTLDVSTLGLTDTWNEFENLTGYIMPTGGSIGYEITSAGSDGTNYVTGSRSTADLEPNGISAWWDGSVWADQASDLTFRSYFGSDVEAGKAIDGDTATFWQSDAGINESITLDMGSVQNCYGLAYYISTAELAAMTETQFQIQTIKDAVPTFESDYSNAGNWTQVGSTITVNSGIADKLAFVATPSNAPRQQVYQDLGFTLSDTEWLLDIDFQWTAFTGGNAFLNILQLSADAIPVAQENALGGDSVQLNFRNDVGVRIQQLASGGANTSGSFIALVQNTQYYLRFIRNSDILLTLEVYDDVDRTNLVGSETLATTATVSGLITVAHSSYDAGSANTASGNADNLAIYDNTTIIPIVANQNLRTINKTDLVADQYNFIRFNGANTQFIRIEGSSGSSLVMAANELAVQVESDPPLTTLHGQFTINGTNIGLPLNGGDPTSSVIEDPLVNSITLNNTVTQGDPATGAGVLWVETVDVDNDGVFAKIKVDGTFKVVRVI